jgi:hypothetical protein
MINPPQVLPEEPTAVTPHGGFCGGKSQQWLRYPTNPLVRICAGGVRQRTSLPANATPPAQAEGGFGGSCPLGDDQRRLVSFCYAPIGYLARCLYHDEEWLSR